MYLEVVPYEQICRDNKYLPVQPLSLYNVGVWGMVVPLIPKSGSGTDASVLPAVFCGTELQSPSSTIQEPILTVTHGDLPFRKPVQRSLRAS